MEDESNNYFDEQLKNQKKQASSLPFVPVTFCTQYQAKYSKIHQTTANTKIFKKRDSEDAERALSTNQEFTDQSFLLKSLKIFDEFFCKGKKLKTLKEVLRPSQLLKSQYHLFGSTTLNDHFEMGDVSTFSFVDALHGLANHPDLLRRLFGGSRANPAGAYFVSLNNDGIWTQVAIDDKIAITFPNNRALGLTPLPHNLKNSDPEIWAFLLEKAYAKLLGGYQNLDKVDLVGCLRDLTGAPCRVVNLRDFIYDRTKESMKDDAGGSQRPSETRQGSNKTETAEIGSVGGFRGSSFGKNAYNSNPANNQLGLEFGSINTVNSTNNLNSTVNNNSGAQNPDRVSSQAPANFGLGTTGNGLFELISNSLQNGNIVLATTLRQTRVGGRPLNFKRLQRPNSVESDRAYPILRTKVINSKVKLINLQYPAFTKVRFSGKWARGSRAWKVFPEVEAQLFKNVAQNPPTTKFGGREGNNGGSTAQNLNLGTRRSQSSLQGGMNASDDSDSFWMSLEELMTKFEDLVVSEVEPGYKQNSIVLKEYPQDADEAVLSGLIKIHVWQDGYFHFDLTQTKNLLDAGYLNQLSMTLLKADSKRSSLDQIFGFVDHVEGAVRSLKISARLAVGEYLALVKSFTHPDLKFSPGLNFSSYGYSTCSLAFLETSPGVEGEDVFDTLTHSAWNQFLRQVDDILSNRALVESHPFHIMVDQKTATIVSEGVDGGSRRRNYAQESDINNNNSENGYLGNSRKIQFSGVQGIPEGGQGLPEVEIEVENVVLIESDVNIFRFRLSENIPEKYKKGYLEVDISFNQSYFTFLGGKVQPKSSSTNDQILVEEEEFDDLNLTPSTIATLSLTSEDSVTLLLRKKFHDELIFDQIGSRFSLEIDQLRFYPLEGGHHAQTQVMLSNRQISSKIVKMMKNSQISREFSPVEESEGQVIARKGYIRSKVYKDSPEVFQKAINAIVSNFDEFMQSNQFDPTLFKLIDDQRIKEIQGTIELQISCWLHLLTKIGTGMVNFSERYLTQILDSRGSSSALKRSLKPSERQLLRTNLVQVALSFDSTRDELERVCEGFELSNTLSRIRGNLVFQEVSALAENRGFLRRKGYLKQRSDSLESGELEDLGSVRETAKFFDEGLDNNIEERLGEEDEETSSSRLEGPKTHRPVIKKMQSMAPTKAAKNNRYADQTNDGIRSERKPGTESHSNRKYPKHLDPLDLNNDGSSQGDEALASAKLLSFGVTHNVESEQSVMVRRSLRFDERKDKQNRGIAGRSIEAKDLKNGYSSQNNNTDGNQIENKYYRASQNPKDFFADFKTTEKTKKGLEMRLPQSGSLAPFSRLETDSNESKGDRMLLTNEKKQCDAAKSHKDYPSSVGSAISFTRLTHEAKGSKISPKSGGRLINLHVGERKTVGVVGGGGDRGGDQEAKRRLDLSLKNLDPTSYLYRQIGRPLNQDENSSEDMVEYKLLNTSGDTVKIEDFKQQLEEERDKEKRHQQQSHYKKKRKNQIVAKIAESLEIKKKQIGGVDGGALGEIYQAPVQGINSLSVGVSSLEESHGAGRDSLPTAGSGFDGGVDNSAFLKESLKKDHIKISDGSSMMNKFKAPGSLGAILGTGKGKSTIKARLQKAASKNRKRGVLKDKRLKVNKALEFYHKNLPKMPETQGGVRGSQKHARTAKASLKASKIKPITTNFSSSFRTKYLSKYKAPYDSKAGKTGIAFKSYQKRLKDLQKSSKNLISSTKGLLNNGFSQRMKVKYLGGSSRRLNAGTRNTNNNSSKNLAITPPTTSHRNLGLSGYRLSSKANRGLLDKKIAEKREDLAQKFMKKGRNVDELVDQSASGERAQGDNDHQDDLDSDERETLDNIIDSFKKKNEKNQRKKKKLRLGGAEKAERDGEFFEKITPKNGIRRRESNRIEDSEPPRKIKFLNRMTSHSSSAKELGQPSSPPLTGFQNATRHRRISSGSPNLYQPAPVKKSRKVINSRKSYFANIQKTLQQKYQTLTTPSGSKVLKTTRNPEVNQGHSPVKQKVPNTASARKNPSTSYANRRRNQLRHSPPGAPAIKGSYHRRTDTEYSIPFGACGPLSTARARQTSSVDFSKGSPTTSRNLGQSYNSPFVTTNNNFMLPASRHLGPTPGVFANPLSSNRSRHLSSFSIAMSGMPQYMFKTTPVSRGSSVHKNTKSHFYGTSYNFTDGSARGLSPLTNTRGMSRTATGSGRRRADSKASDFKAKISRFTQNFNQIGDLSAPYIMENRQRTIRPMMKIRNSVGTAMGASGVYAQFRGSAY